MSLIPHKYYPREVGISVKHSSSQSLENFSSNQQHLFLFYIISHVPISYKIMVYNSRNKAELVKWRQASVIYSHHNLDVFYVSSSQTLLHILQPAWPRERINANTVLNQFFIIIRNLNFKNGFTSREGNGNKFIIYS